MSAQRKRLWPLIVLCSLGLLGLLALAAWLLFPRFLLQYIEQQAQARGVQLSECQLQVKWPQLQLSQCRLELLRAGAKLQGKVDKIEILVTDFKPASVGVDGAHLELLGLPEFSQLFEHQTAALEADLPVDVNNSDLVWSLDADKRVTLTQLKYSAPSGNFSTQVDVAGLFKGNASRSADVIQLELDLVQKTSTRLHLRVQQGKERGELRAEFQKLPLSELAELGLLKPALPESWIAEGQLYVAIPIGLNPEVGKGDFSLSVQGLNFPVPLELQGLVYGTPGQLESQFVLDRSFTQAQLKKTRFRIGALDMRGQGQVELQGTSLNFSTNLSGHLACDAIVRAAVSAHTDTQLGKLAGRIAKLALKGSVELSAAVQGNTLQLDKVSVSKSVGVGCGIKPIALPEIPEALRGLPEEIQKRLPKLPEPGKPPQLPKLPLPRFPPPKNVRPAPDHPPPTPDSSSR